MNSARRFFRSMTGRIFMILLLGVAISAGVAWVLADAKRQVDLGRLEVARTADRMHLAVDRWTSADTPEEVEELATEGAVGVRYAPANIVTTGRDELLTTLLAQELGQQHAVAEKADPSTCHPLGLSRDGPRQLRDGRPGWMSTSRRCWLVTVSAPNPLRLVIETPPRPRGDPLLFEPIYIGILVLMAAALSLLVARMAAAPLSTLARAATAIGGDLQQAPMAIAGPTEVQRAAEAFNLMQARLQTQLAERMHTLAAITHDLQTPVTRLRLRLERVQDVDLRERLLADLGAMQTLIREGLELARSADRKEPAQLIDVPSLLESLVEDAADAGQEVSLASTVDVGVKARPEALRRCVLNLIENALKYGGSAEVSAAVEDGRPMIRVRDHGPGLPEDQLDAVFAPFVRLEDSRSRDTGGAGLGLTIARTLAERDGATVSLRNHPQGGAEAVIRFPVAA